jgi:CheY-like chemotaxis protein
MHRHKGRLMSQAQKCRILIVEDQAAISMLIEDMLLDLGLEVVEIASKLDRALELAQTLELDAAVLDINIAGVFSYAVADILRARDIPVIFATGYNASVLPERFQGTPVLHKPFTQQQFGEALQSVLTDAPCEIEPATG